MGVGEIADISTSILYGVSESAKSCGKYQLLRITDIQDNCVDWSSVPFTDYDNSKANQYLLVDGDILFARTGATVGKSYLVKTVPSNCIYASYLIRIKTSFEVLPEYLKLFFESGFYWQQITEGAVGVGQPNVNGTTLSQLRLPMPPKNEQIKIVVFVNSLLGFIDNIEASNSRLLDAIALTKSKILDLAMQGKLVPQDPSDEPAAEMLRRVNPKAEVITDNPHLRNIPKYWTLVKVRDVFSPMRRQMPISEYFSYIDIDSVDNKTNTVKPKNLLSKDAPSRATRFTQKGDVVFSMVRPYLRNIAKVPFDACIASTGFYVFSPTSAVNQEFAFKMILSSFFVDGLNVFMKGDNSPSITKDNVDEFVIPLPPLNEQKRIASKIEELYSILYEIEASLQA